MSRPQRRRANGPCRIAAGNDMALLRTFTSLVGHARRAARHGLAGRRLVHGVAIAQGALFQALLVGDEAAVGRPIASLLAPRIILSIDRLDADQKGDPREGDKDHSLLVCSQRNDSLPAGSARAAMRLHWPGRRLVHGIGVAPAT